MASEVESALRHQFAASNDLLVDVQRKFVYSVLLIWSCIAAFSVPVSVARISDTGWLNIYSVHIFLGVAVIAVSLKRAAIPLAFLKAFICLVLLIVGTAGLFTFGVATSGVVYLIFFNMAVALFYQPKVFFASCSLSLILFIVAGFGFYSGYLKLPISSADYFLLPLSWVNVIFASAPVVFAFFYGFSIFTNKVEKLIDELKESHSLILTGQEAAQMGHYVTDLRTGTWTNDSLFDGIFGIDSNFQRDFSGWQRIMHPEDSHRVFSYFESSLNEKIGLASIEYRIIRPSDGEVRWISAWGRNTFDLDGKPVQQSGLIQDITNRKNSEALIENQANYDQLTQFPNRRLFHDRLIQAIKKSSRSENITSLLLIDLDRFKEVNDSLGHDIGDLLLVEAAQRIKLCVRECDTVARLGGDEFTVILTDLESSSDIGRIAQKIIDRLTTSFLINGSECFISASIGITVYPDDAVDATELIKNADQAMYKAKNEGRSRFHFFTKAMQQAAELHSRLAHDLRRALDANQFEVYFQPIIDFSDGSISKAEALLRWNHPMRGQISPAFFIPIAEETGAINDIGDWVFEQAALQAKKLSISTGCDFQISINKSPVQFNNDDYLHGRWIDRLRELDLPGNSIVIEITEGLLMNDSSKVSDRLIHFREAGIMVSIDDFGTGYSALSYLKKFNIDFLKIDKSFTSNLAPDADDFALCEAIVVMSHKLGIKVIAEGVETQQQLELLKQIGCDYGQGYLFSRPLPAAEFERLLAITCEPLPARPATP